MQKWYYLLAPWAMLMAHPTPAVPVTTPEGVLASARAAAGGVGDSNYVGYINQSGSIQSSGLRGHWSKVIDLASGKTREEANFDLFSTAAVWDGRRGWRQDISGGAHPIDSKFMRSVLVTDAWLAQFGYLRRHALGAAVELLEDREAEGRSYTAVRATPRQGQPVELWFEKDSRHLARTVQILPIRVRTVRYDDYRKVHDLLIPFKITRDNGDASDAEVIQIERTERGVARVNDFSPPRAPDDFEIAEGRCVVPIELHGDCRLEAFLLLW
jgi:hypothetical protein